MKNHQIAYWMAAIGTLIFLYQVHRISGLNEEAAVLRSQFNAHKNPVTGTYVRAFFDGLTLGAFADEGIFNGAKKSEREDQYLESARASILSRYEDAVSYLNWGLLLAVSGFVGGVILEKKKTKGGTLI